MENNHTTLRAAAFNTIQGAKVVVDRLDLQELLHEFDLLKAAGQKKEGYSAEFEEAWSEYPKRTGHSKAAAYKAWNARLKAGCSLEAMIEGLRRFAAAMKAEQREDRHIMHASTFFGPDCHFDSNWSARQAPAKSARPSRAEQQAAANAEALARLGGIPMFDPNVIDAEVIHVAD